MARRYGLTCVRDLPREGVLFTAGDNLVFTSRYLRSVEGIQEGLTLVSRIGLVSPTVRDALRREQPEWEFPSEGEVANLQDEEPSGEALRLSAGEREAPTWLSPLCRRVVEGIPETVAVGWELGGEDEALRERLDSVGFVSLVRTGRGRDLRGPGLLSRSSEYVEQVSELGAQFYLRRDACFAYATKFNEAGVLETRRGFPRDALALYEVALFLNPRQATTLGNLAMTRKRLDPDADIVPLLRRAVSQNPLNLALMWTMCSELVAEERFEEAREGYEGMLRLSPGIVGPLIGLHDLAEKTEGDAPWEKGITDRILARIREDSNAALFVSKWAFHEEKWAFLDACLQAWPSHPTIQRRGAEGLLRRGGEDEGIRSLQEHVHRFPEDAKAWHTLGNALRRKGFPSEAKVAYEKAYALGVAGAARNLSLCLIEEGQLGRAEGWLLRALEADPEDVESWVSLAAVLGQ